MNRRQFLSTAALGSSTSCIPACAEPSGGFRYRGYLGWITDLATFADTYAEWPSMRIDEPLLRDYRQTFRLMRQLGLKDLCVWGLYVSRAWPVDIKSAVPLQRNVLVEKLIADARANGMRVLSGLGVYSWGFEEILRANPQLRKTSNKSATCGSEEESWEWMRKVIDFVFTQFPIDGVSMQSADQGRCTCEKCRRYTETEYHSMLNTRCAQYIRSRWPGKLVAVSGWGMRLDNPSSLPALATLGRNIDYLIDVRDTSRQKDPAFRKKLISLLQCAFGTIGGPQVEPPQHWQRDRWFLPTVASAGRHLEQLYADGGRACEWFFHILANPGCEITTWVAGKILADPTTSWRRHLDSSVEQIYRVKNVSVRDGLSEAFLAAEDAYMRYVPPDYCGTISMEPLVSSQPGPPVYITKRLTSGQRTEYGTNLKRVQDRFAALQKEVPEQRRVQFILRALNNARKDLST